MLGAVATTHSRVLWYLTRGSGLVALVLLTASVVLGILEVKRWATERWPRFVTAALHKNVSLLAVVFLGLHIATTVVDGFAPIGWIDVVVPFHSPYRPLWLGLGAIAVDLMLALVVTSLLRGRIGYRAWKAVHWAAYACWPVAVLHGMGSGTDTKLGLVLLINFACLGAVVLAVWWRLADAWSQRVVRSGVALGTGVASVAVPVGIVAFLLAGPLKPGWARRAGTPASLTTASAAVAAPAGGAGASGSGSGGTAGGSGGAGGAGAAGGSSSGGGASGAFSAPFTDSFGGTIDQSASGTTVTLDGTLSGQAPGHLRIVLNGQPSSGGGIVMTSSAVSLGPAGQPNLYEGSVRSLSGSRLRLAVTDPAGNAISVRVQLSLSGGTSVTGTVSGGAATGGGDD